MPADPWPSWLIAIGLMFGTEQLAAIWILELFTFGCEGKKKKHNFSDDELKLAGKLHEADGSFRSLNW